MGSIDCGLYCHRAWVRKEDTRTRRREVEREMSESDIYMSTYDEPGAVSRMSPGDRNIQGRGK